MGWDVWVSGALTVCCVSWQGEDCHSGLDYVLPLSLQRSGHSGKSCVPNGQIPGVGVGILTW